MSRRSFVPSPSRPIARKGRPAAQNDQGKCPYCQEKPRVSQPGDALEHEADRAANAVMNRTPAPSLSSASGQFQRDPKDDKKPAPASDDSRSLGTGLGKVAEAVAKTPAGKKVIDKAGEEAKKVMSNPAAAAATGLIAGGAVAGMAATNQKLPFQPPAIPIGDTGLKAGLRYEGHMRAPSYVGLTLGGNLPGEPKEKKDKQKDSSGYRAETERLRADLERFKPKPHVYTPPPGALAPLAPVAPVAPVASVAPPTIQPPSPAHEPAPAPEPARKKEAKPPLQRKARGSGEITAEVWDALDEGGQALDAATLRFMEQRFGRDFSAVRIHSGPRGAQASDALNARAFTYGEHIGFASGEYHPATESGRRLLAHELAHVVQQGVAPPQSSAAAMPSRADGSSTRSPVTPPLSSAPTPTVARAAKPPPKEAVDITLDSAGELNNLKFKVWPEEATDGTVKGLKAFNVDGLVLPASKGANALVVYERYAAGNALSSTVRVAGDAQASLWQERASTDQLKSRWLDMRGWPGGKGADKYWEKAGGDDTFPRVNDKACQMDHIVELQLGGNNTNENIQALDGNKNQDSGRTIWAEMSGLARAISENSKLDTKGAVQVRMHFVKARMQGTPDKLTSTCKGKQPSCLAVETCASKVKLDKADVRTDGIEPYQLTTEGGHETEVNVPLGFAKNATAKPVSFEESDNKAAATLIPGFVLKTLHHGPGGKRGSDGVAAAIDTETKTRLPLAFDAAIVAQKSAKAGKGAAGGKRDPAPVKFEVNGPKNTLKLAKGNVKIPFYYPYLSPGEITKLTPTPDGVDFVGSITPSVPFLGKLDIAYEKGALSVTKGLDPEKIKPPLPGAKITKASIGLELAPTLQAKGELAFDYAPGGKKLLDAALTASADTQGLKVAGDIHAYLPGVDSAQGHIEYSTTGGWSGGAKATANDLKKKFKYVSGGELSIGFKGNKQGGVSVDAEGSVTLDLPHTKGLTATLKNKGGRWLFQGKGTFEVPRLKPVDIAIEYDGTHLSGEARNIGFKYKDFDASIDIKYHDEKFSGSGKLAFEKGRAKGTLQINLLPNERFTGKGNVTLQIKEGLEASAGVELDEREKLHINGKLAFTKPIKLFDGFGGDATIFKAGVSIPIPGASIGPVGVKARIEGELKAGYHVGPGEIRNASAEANFDPLEDNPNVKFEIGGQLWIGASAHITGAITGSIVLDVGIAEASGGLTVSATASLNGEVLSNVKFTYEKSRYALTADFAASLALAIRLALEASVRAAAGIRPFEVSTEKRWTLAERQFNTGLKLGIQVKKPLSYSSDKGLEVPGPSDIEITKPNLDPSRLLKDVFGAADGKEKQA